MLLSFLVIGTVCGVIGTSTETYHDNNPQCDCYEVDGGGSPIYFHNFRFYDFSHEANSTTDFRNEPALVTTPGGNENVTSPIFESAAFTAEWGVQNWGMTASDNNSLPRWNSPQNVYFMQTNASDMGSADSTATTFLRLRASKNPTFYSIGEIENTQANMFYASIRFYARVSGSKGACGGMFLYASEVQETDVEVLTSSSGEIFYSNQPDVDSEGNSIPAATIIVNSPGLDWTKWHEHRIDWTPSMTWWYIDNVLVANTTYQVPDTPMGAIVNMWSDGGVWTGAMPSNGVTKLDIQWMQAAFNTSGPQSGHWEQRFPHPSKEKHDSSGCTQVCKIDGVAKIGTPELGSPTFNSSESFTGTSTISVTMISTEHVSDSIGSTIASNTASASASKASPSKSMGITHNRWGRLHAAAAFVNTAARLI